MQVLLYILLAIVIVIILGIVIVLFVSPYPFVWFLRRDENGEHKDKSPEGFHEILPKIHIEKDCQYPSDYARSQYDVYYPKDAKACPVLIWVHGGSFIGGDKIGTRAFGPLMANAGYAVFSINYERAPEAKYPSQIKQLDDFIRYLKTKETTFPIDVKQIFIGGDSAGANIVACYGAIASNLKLASEVNMTLALAAKDIGGLILYCGPYDFTFDRTKVSKYFRFFMNQIGWSYGGVRKWWKTSFVKQASPVHQVTSDFPPSYIMDGNAFSFEGHAKALVKALEREAIFVESRFFEHDKEIPHEFQFDYKKYPLEAQAVFDDTLNFLMNIRKKQEKE